MKSTLDQLTSKERKLLALFYDTETYNALKKLLIEERLNIATKLLDVASNDVVTIARHQGRADFAKQLNLTLRENYKTQNKES